MFNKTVTMSIPEFLSNCYERDNCIAYQKQLVKKIVFVMACLMIAQQAQEVYAASNLGKIDKAGSVILGICRNIGYWACIIMCVIEIIKTLMQGDTKGVSKVISKYLLGFGALYLIPWLFDLIKSIFS